MILAAGAFVLGANLTFADGAGDPAPVKTEGGKYYDKEGIQGSAAIIRIAMSVTVPTAKDRATPRRSAVT